MRLSRLTANGRKILLDQDGYYQPSKDDMKKDVSVPVKPERLGKAVMCGGARRRDHTEKEKS